MKTRLAALALIALTLLGVVSLAFGSGDGGRVLSVAHAKRLFLQLPYQFEFRYVPLPEGASGALAGKAITARGIDVNFGVALGRHPEGVAVPRAGTINAYGYPDGGFVFTDDLLLRGKGHGLHAPARFRKEGEWSEAGEMDVEMEEKLCKAATGKPCPP